MKLYVLLNDINKDEFRLNEFKFSFVQQSVPLHSPGRTFCDPCTYDYANGDITLKQCTVKRLYSKNITMIY